MKLSKIVIPTLGLFSLCLSLFAATSVTAKEEKLPDVVIFLTDDHSQLDSSAYGSKEFRTPNIQRLADSGMTFDQAFVASPSCAPSRAALLTGLMPARNGAEANHAKAHANIKKWPAYFKELGYEVVAFGKVSHYKHTVDYGFDHFANDTFHDHGGIAGAAEFLKKRKSANAKPLCLFVGSNWPHVPWPEGYEGYHPKKLSLPAGSIDTKNTREWRARYAAAVTRGDNDLGVILDAARANLGENTFFLFSSDHGTQWPFGKWNCYDAGIRVPLIVSWPGVVKPGTRSDAMVSWVDFLPTVLDAAGGNTPGGIDGKSFAPVLRGKQTTHRSEIFTTHSGDGRWNVYPIRSVRTDDWKYIRNLHPEFAFTTHIDLAGNLGQRAYFSTWEDAAKTNELAAEIVKRYHVRPAEELYDLRADPHEQRNLADDPQHAAVLKKMRKQVKTWMRKQDDAGTVFDEPRLLNDPNSFGPDAPNGNSAPKTSPKSNKES